jgi:hypothetical protein
MRDGCQKGFYLERAGPGVMLRFLLGQSVFQVATRIVF